MEVQMLVALKVSTHSGARVGVKCRLRPLLHQICSPSITRKDLKKKKTPTNTQ